MTIRRYQFEHMSAKPNGDPPWGDIGYHYLVDRFGTIWAGRDLHYQGAHVADNNPGNLGISFIFDGEHEALTDAARQSAVDLAAWWCNVLVIRASEIKGHRDYNATACPGQLIYPAVAQIRSAVAELTGR